MAKMYSFLYCLGADVTLSIPVISAKVGTTASVTCTVTGETFDGWYKPDSSKITTSSGANIRVESSGNDHVLKFVDVQLSYGSNNYQCRGSKNTEKFWFHVASKYMSFHFNLHVCYPTLLHGGQIANMNNYFWRSSENHSLRAIICIILLFDHVVSNVPHNLFQLTSRRLTNISKSKLDKVTPSSLAFLAFPSQHIRGRRMARNWTQSLILVWLCLMMARWN